MEIESGKGLTLVHGELLLQSINEVSREGTLARWSSELVSAHGCEKFVAAMTGTSTLLDDVGSIAAIQDD